MGMLEPSAILFWIVMVSCSGLLLYYVWDSVRGYRSPHARLGYNGRRVAEAERPGWMLVANLCGLVSIPFVVFGSQFRPLWLAALLLFAVCAWAWFWAVVPVEHDDASAGPAR